MKDHIKAYMDKLEKGICDYMQMPISERSAEAVKHMAHAYKAVKQLEKSMEKKCEPLTHLEITEWSDKMQNADGTMGAHWDKMQTSAVAESIGLMFDHITEMEWYITLNMMYSDYCKVAEKYGVGTPDFYADMAKAFLFDSDAKSPKYKLAAYYHHVVK